MYNYHCANCDCRLDPGEGRLCEECRQEFRERQNRAERIRDDVLESDGGQIEMILHEVYGIKKFKAEEVSGFGDFGAFTMV